MNLCPGCVLWGLMHLAPYVLLLALVAGLTVVSVRRKP